MKSISFDNPYLLLLAIPLAVAVVLPYIISVNKDNRSISWRISLGIHIAASLIAAVALAGLASVTTLTKTQVYVVADVSHSSSRSFAETDERIKEIERSLPKNSTLGVVCFAKDCELLTLAGADLKSVSEARVDGSATDIAGALGFTEQLFESDVLKRIVLITDGNDTVSENSSGLAAAVDGLTERGIKIDAVYLDNSLKDGECEVQLSGVDYTESTYAGHDTEAKLLIQSSGSTNVMVELYSRSKAQSASDGEYVSVAKTVVSVEPGLSTVRMTLPSDKADTFEYKAALTAESDISHYNDSIVFTQTVDSGMDVLLITGSGDDEAVINGLYSDLARVDTCFVGESGGDVPFMLDELALYDEIILSNVDVRNINNVNAFLDSLEIVISQYGKSLIAVGDLKIQDAKDDAVLLRLEELLPVEYGNSARDGKLYTIVLDVSHSMEYASKLLDACDAAIKLISLLDDEDYVCLVTFSGKVTVKTPKLLRESESEIVEYIGDIKKNVDTSHGTDIGVGLEEALKAVRGLGLSENQVMVISDGMSFDSTVDSIEISTELFRSGTPVSAIAVWAPMDGTQGDGGRENLQSIVNCGEGGVYAEIKAGTSAIDGVIFGTVSDSITEAVIRKDSSVNVERPRDAVVSGIEFLSPVSGYIQSFGKYDATVPLTVNYVKANGYEARVPLYAYRSHGNGRAVSFTGSFTDGWISLWSEEERSAFAENIFLSNIPKENHDYPFTVSTERGTHRTRIQIIPSIYYPTESVSIKITPPTGESYTKELAFDSYKYVYDFDSYNTGSYDIEITYGYLDKSYTTDVCFNVWYLPEYDAFAAFDKARVYELIRGNGTITEGTVPSLEPDESEISTYKVSYTVPLLIAVAVLFACDVIIRKLDIRGVRARRGKTDRKKGV